MVLSDAKRDRSWFGFLLLLLLRCLLTVLTTLALAFCEEYCLGGGGCGGVGALSVLLLHVSEDLGNDGLVFAAVLQCAWV